MKASTMTTIRLPNDLIQWVDTYAAREHRSRNGLIRHVLEELREKRPAEQHERVLAEGLE